MGRAIDLKKKFPFQERVGDYFLKGNGEISRGFSFGNAPNVYSLSYEESNNITVSISNLLRLLPSNSRVQFHDLFTVKKYKPDIPIEEIENFVVRENLKYYEGREYLDHQKNMYLVTSPHSRVTNSPFLSSFLTFRDWLTKKPYQRSEDCLKDIITATDTITNTFNTLNSYRLNNMTGDDYCCALHDYFNMGYAQPASKNQNLMINPIRGYKGEMKMGNQFVKVLTMIREGDMLYSQLKNQTFPKSAYENNIDYNEKIMIDTSGIYPIGLGLLFDHILNTTIEVFDNSDMVLFLRQLKSKHQFGKAFRNEDSRNLVDQVDDAEKEVSQKTQRFCRTTVSLIINDISLERLNKKAELAKIAFQRMDKAECWIENEDVGNLIWASAPGVADTNYRSFVSTNDKSAYYFHKETVFKEDKVGYIFCERHSGKPVRVDFMGEHYSDFHHFGIFAPTGSGKSYSAQSLVNQALAFSEHVLIIDKQDSYRRTGQVNGGKRFDAKIIREKGLPLFLCAKDEKGNYVYFDKTTSTDEIQPVDFVYATLKLIWRENEKVTPLEKRILSESIEEYYKKINSEKNIIPTLTGYYEYLPEYIESVSDQDVYKKFPFDELVLMLKPYAVGDKKNLLNATEPFDIINDKFVIFEVGGINGIDLDIVNLNISNLALQKFSQLPKAVRKLLIIDEAIDFLVGEMGSQIGGFFRKARKLGGIVGIITQTVKFLLNADPMVRDSILSNMGIKILLGIADEEEQIKSTIEILGLNENDEKLLRSMQRQKHYREFFIKIGIYAFILRHEVSPVAHAVFTTDSKELDKIKELEIQNNGDIEIASKMYVQYKS